MAADYLSEDFISVAKETDKRRKLTNRRNRPPRGSTRQKQRKVRQEQRKVLEEESREKGLNEPLPESNKGFKILEKMGYKPGMGLGREGKGMISPIQIDIKSGKSGLGKDKLKRQELMKIRNKLIQKQRQQQGQRSEVNYQDRMRSKFEDRKIIGQLKQLISITRQLDEEVKRGNNPLLQQYEELEKQEEPIPLREYIELIGSEAREESHLRLLEYLRSHYLYCFFCGTKFDHEDELNSKCPGLAEEVHV